jgi:hypothetical protein
MTDVRAHKLNVLLWVGAATQIRLATCPQIFTIFVMMSKVKDLFPEITRPGEYVAFLNFNVPTIEGPAYMFMACDGYSEFGFHICAEKDESPASVIKAVYLLTENKDFLQHRDKGFTLVFDRWEELSARLESVVKPVNGQVVFNKNFHKKIAAPLVSSMKQFLKNGPRR